MPFLLDIFYVLEHSSNVACSFHQLEEILVVPDNGVEIFTKMRTGRC